ncbi:helix-hairpin-helix domain-containing protein [Flavobacterium amniphilum]|uniref:ComEA family DNA-binding protein n=1 Tax=Flavobacterium amniphilum TaxID=1834035 RepID=UPI00202A4CB1|nr:helix-hairpin-helix domain-containing protein [Flavobacterium amniphilum]MCL9807335.1 helix-hairpin-helix domain-containing protein [Flavobacterium amniphilum]
MNFNTYLRFNREQRIGLVILAGLIIAFQLVYCFVDFSSEKVVTVQEEEWLSMQTEVDSLKKVSAKPVKKIYSFNPNFITDYKGNKLGMSVAEIDRLLAFRETGKYVNSAEEFQAVTKVSDSLLAVVSPYFKFPDWVKNRKNFNYQKNEYQIFEKKEKKITVIDINQATKEELMAIYGIGDAISDRILKQKETLGGFVSMDQLEDVWGLSPEVVSELNKHFKIVTVPDIVKIDINNESVKNLSKFPYFRYALAKEIVTYRSMNNGIKSIEELTKIKGFPIEKVKIIALYLDFK